MVGDHTESLIILSDEFDDMITSVASAYAHSKSLSFCGADFRQILTLSTGEAVIVATAFYPTQFNCIRCSVVG